jgi:hypothetical protein
MGLVDGVFTSGDPAARAHWFDRARDSGSRGVRLIVPWAVVAPGSPPSDFDPADPAHPAYNWAWVDAAVRDARARGLEVLVNIGQAPRWAEGPDRPDGVAPGAWRPDPGQFGAFMHAAARRYSGAFPDPQLPGQALPRVRYWQIWNEPNLSLYVAPQWSREGGVLRAESPSRYRALLDAAYRALKGVNSSNVVVTAGTAPYGDLAPGGGRIPPARFVRELLCFRDRRLRRAACPSPATFDVLAHHPYSIGGPRRAARNRDDVALVDLGKLLRPLRAARRHGSARPRGRARLWITEVSWDSRPPDPAGVPASRHARWLSQAMDVLWSNGAESVFWFRVRDQDPVPSYPTTTQSGLFLADGRPKLAARAFRFPFTAEIKGRRVRVWGRAPARGRVLVQRRRGRGWATVARARARRDGVFTTRIGRSGRALRARQGRQTSLSARPSRGGGA